MRFLHTSDWHLGITLGGVSIADEQKNFIDRLVQVIQEEKIDAVVIAGDIYDSSVSNSEAISLYNYAANRICMEEKIPMLVIAGNHDGAARLASCKELLAGAGLYVTGKLTGEFTPVSIDDADFYSLPYFNIEEVKALFPEKAEEIKSYEQAEKLLCDRILEQADKTRKNILISHAFVVGAALSDSDRSARVGTATAVSKDVFAGFDYVALGHIHRPQQISTAIKYAGSPFTYSFGSEEKYEKSFTVVDTKTMEQKEIPVGALKQVRTLHDTYENIMEAPESKDFLRLEITDRFIGLETLSALRNRFPFAIEVCGKSFELEENENTLNIDAIAELTKQDIVTMFFEEMYGYKPSVEQLSMVNNAAEKVEEGGELS